jgi:hypothetical protein
MKKVILILILTCTQAISVFAQGKYVPVKKEYFTPFYEVEKCKEIDVRVPANGPWYVFSDREKIPVYKNESGNDLIQNVDLGVPFLVIGEGSSSLKVIDADKVDITMSSGTWKFRAGVSADRVLQGWIPKENLLLSQKCLKVCDADIPTAPAGIFNLQGLYIYNVAWRNDNHKYFWHVPNNYGPNVTKIPLNESDRFGYIFKIIQVNGVEWFLIGDKAEIKLGDKQIILKGWKPREQIELWKHRLAMEYDWQNVSSRVSSGIRLNITRDPHTASISRDEYSKRPFVDKEYNYKKGTASKNYYYERELGTGFRNVVLREDLNNIKVGVLKNSCNVDEKIVNPARAIANDIMVSLLKPKVIFVLDGTESLRNQQQNIINTIKTTVSRIVTANTGTAIEYQYCATIYRDKDYKNYIFEKLDNFTGIDVVGNWINTNLTAAGKNFGDRSQAEAVFYGLNETFQLIEAIKTKSFFNPTFYVLIGDCGSHQRKDDSYVSRDVIIEGLKCNVSDLVAIQFSHSTRMTDDGVPDNGKSFDLFQTQFRDILSIFGKPNVKSISGGTLEEFPSRPGSFLAYPRRDTSFTETALSSVIQQALMNYNTTVQEKIIQLAIMLRNPSTSCPEVKRELELMTKNFIAGKNLDVSNVDQVMEWVIRFIENAASSINSKSGTKIEITNDCYNFFNPGYIASSYSFLNHTPFKHVIYLSSNNLDRIRDFAYRISTLRAANIRAEIQRTWQHMLMISLGVFQNVNQVNDLTICEATSILTGFKGSSKYENIKIGDITKMASFPDQLMYEYVFEWGITYGYLQSVRNGSWELDVKNLRSQIAVINALLKSRKKSNITDAQFKALSEKLAKRDSRPLLEYYKGYPYEELDILYKLRAYWIEADFFSTEDNDFVKLLLSVVK